MKYTRYNINKKKSSGIYYFLLAAGVLVLAFIIGTIFFNYLMKNDYLGKRQIQPDNGIEVTKTKNQALKPDKIKDSEKSEIVERNNDESSLESNEAICKEEEDINIFTTIQCGVFRNASNAEACANRMDKYGEPFIVKEGEFNRVILGIYNEENIDNIINKLKNNSEEYTQHMFRINCLDDCSMQICKIIDANLLIINKFDDKSIEYVNTKELKSWVSQLPSIDENMNGVNELKNLKEHAAKLPERVTKKELEKENTYLYNFLKNNT